MRDTRRMIFLLLSSRDINIIIYFIVDFLIIQRGKQLDVVVVVDN